MTRRACIRKLSDDEALQARKRAASGVPISVLARESGMSSQAMFSLVYGLTYSNVPGALDRKRTYARHPGRKLSDDQVRTMRRERKAGKTLHSLSKRWRLSIRSIVQACSGEHYSEVE